MSLPDQPRRLTPRDTLRVLVVDDTRLYRQLLSEIFSTIDGVEVVGTAEHGQAALEKIAQLRPDLVTLDVAMPTMDGLETLRHLHGMMAQMAVIMVSAHTVQGAHTTMQALELGAFDFITKPQGSGLSDNVEHMRNQLRPLINAWHTKKCLRALVTGDSARPRPATPRGEARLPVEPVRRQSASPHVAAIDIVAIGVSTGGPQALAQVIPKLPAGLRVPIVIVQHMPPMFTSALAASLNDKSALKVVEGGHGLSLEAGTVYIAPGGKHMKIARHDPGHAGSLLITDDPPEYYCKPSANYLFRSVAEVYGSRALGVIMTGMGADGVLGLQLMKQRGARVLAQDEASCVVFGMPCEAIKAGVVDAVVPLEQLADAISKHVGER